MNHLASPAGATKDPEICNAKRLIFTACTLSSLAVAVAIAVLESPMGVRVLFGPLVMTLYGLWMCRKINVSSIPNLIQLHADGWGHLLRNCVMSALAFVVVLHAAYFGILTLQTACA